MPGKFYLNAAFLLLHFWRSLPRQRHSQRLPFFLRFIVASQSRACDSVWWGRKSNGKEVFRFKYSSKWIFGRCLRLWHWWKGGIIRLLIFQRRDFVISSERRAWARKRWCITNDLKPVQNVEAGKALRWNYNFHAFLPCLYCIKSLFLYGSPVTQQVFSFVLFAFHSAEGKAKARSFFMAGSCLIESKRSSRKCFFFLRSYNRMVVPASNQAYTGIDSFLFRRCEDDGKLYLFPFFLRN